MILTNPKQLLATLAALLLALYIPMSATAQDVNPDTTFATQDGIVSINSVHGVLRVPTGHEFLDAPRANHLYYRWQGEYPGTTLIGALIPANLHQYDEVTNAAFIFYSECGHVDEKPLESYPLQQVLVWFGENDSTEWAFYPTLNTATHSATYGIRYLTDTPWFFFSQVVLGRKGAAVIQYTCYDEPSLSTARYTFDGIFAFDVPYDYASSAPGESPATASLASVVFCGIPDEALVVENPTSTFVEVLGWIFLIALVVGIGYLRMRIMNSVSQLVTKLVNKIF